MVATTLTALAAGDSAGVAAAEAGVLIGAGGGAVESADPQPEITRVTEAIKTTGALRIR